MKANFECKGVTHVLEQTLTEYAQVAAPDPSTSRKADVEEVAQKSQRKTIFLNVEKKTKYLKDAGTIKVSLLKGLDNDDQALLDEYETPAELWKYLKSKYFKPSKLAAAQYTKELKNFEFTSGLTIMDAYNKLKEIRRKIASTKPSAKGQYDHEALLLILISALPKVYQSTVDYLSINNELSVDEQLKHLENKEERLRFAPDNEHAHTARTLRQRVVAQNSNRAKILTCKYLGWAQNQVRREKREKKKLSSSSRTHVDSKKKSSKKSRGFVGTNVDESSSSSETCSSSSSDESVVETAALTKEQKRKSCKRPSEWPIDTGASSHMTDQLKLFRGPLEKLKKKRQIQVGGSILRSEARGTVRVEANDGSFCYLKDCLFVPGLGINLISARCLCRDGIVGIHDSKNIYFKKLDEFLQFKNDHKTFLHAKQKNGLYMLKSIFSENPELAFVSNESYVQRSSSIEFDENSKGGRLDLRLRNLPSQPRGRPRKFPDDNQQQLTSHSSPNEQIESQQLNVEQPSTQDIELVDAPEIAPSPKLPAIQQEPVDNTIKISGHKITFELPTIAEPSAIIKNDEALGGKSKVTVASQNATSSTQVTTSKDEKRRKEKKSSGQKKKKSKDKAHGKEKRRRKVDELETTETSMETQESDIVCEEINSQPSTNNESLPLESSKVNEAEVTARLLSKQVESQATMGLDSESEDDHRTTKKRRIIQEYFFRPRKRSGNGDEDKRQAKRIRAMISFFKNQRNKLVKADQLEHALAAMAQPQIYGKRVRKGIFKGLYALFCRMPDNDEDYTLEAKIIQGITIPRTYKEAMRSPQAKEWEEAVKTEIDQLIMNGTWEEMLLPKGANLVSTKWVFTIKETVNGNIERFKARLVARGFSQSQGIDYTETFAPTVRMDTFRIFLATIAKRDLKCYQFDIKNAFTESQLKEDIPFPSRGSIGSKWESSEST
ncbi:hypothetical protein K3495_g5522 [Podosphaera aphanis]|nr:hypothetical protein K3495_g5522 [Podosphaera aphanis]